MKPAHRVSQVLFISGPPGIGKTSVAKAVARRLYIPYYDLDDVLETTYEESLSVLVKMWGWSRFRSEETKILMKLIEEVSSLNHYEPNPQETGSLISIISLGGGTVTSSHNRTILKAHGVVMTLWGSVRLLSERLEKRAQNESIMHPLPIDTLPQLSSLLNDRLESYLDCDIWLEIYDGEAPEQIAARVISGWSAYLDKPKESAYAQWFKPPEVSQLRTLPVDHISTDVDITDINAVAITVTDEVSQQTIMEDEPMLVVHDYNIYFRSNSESELIKRLINLAGSITGKSRKIGIISDECVAQLYAGPLVGQLQASKVEAHLMTFPSGEQSKQLRVVEALATRLLHLEFDRHDYLVAFGGGVTGDLCGFLASIYLRGISWVQIPTTLLAQVDSSVGAKTAVNHPLGKNLLGSFYRPLWVWTDDYYLKTLPPRQIQSGCVEAIKHGLISDRSFYDDLVEFLRDKSFIEYAHTLDWSLVIQRAVGIKSEIVGCDEREHNIRALLNLGHTIGHAIEKTHSECSHGEAVALGLSFSAEYSHHYHHLPIEQRDLILETLKTAGHQIHWRQYISEHSLQLIEVDKKRTGSQLNYVILIEIGEARIESIDLKHFLERVLELSRG